MPCSTFVLSFSNCLVICYLSRESFGNSLSISTRQEYLSKLHLWEYTRKTLQKLLLMASSDEEGEIVPNCITNYHFVDRNGAPVSFSILPLQWEIHVLSKDKVWIKLLKPRKSYADTIRTVLITVHFLHFVKKNPDAVGEIVWNYIGKSLSAYEVLPSKDDLLEHMPTVKEAARRDKDLSSSKIVVAMMMQMQMKMNSLIMFVFFVMMGENFCECCTALMLSVCMLYVSCEGCCIRSFHLTVESGAESRCESLSYRNHQAIQTFLCKNCQYQRHQCFACGLLGSSDKSTGAEVFPCISATCGHFFHPKCVSELLYSGDKCRALELQKEIVAGESFTCPAHKCSICKQGEDKKEYELQFAICRRCPRAYHRRCLPRCISFEPSHYDRNIQRRAWNDLLPCRILIYCVDHKIISKIRTPKRDHILFPQIDGKANSQSSGLPSGPVRMLSRRSKVLGALTETSFLNMKRPFEARHSATEVGDSYGKGKQLKPPTHERGKSKAPLKLVCTPQSTFSGKTVNVRPIMPVMKKASISQQLADNEMKKE